MAKIADRNNLKAERILWTHGLREFHYGRDSFRMVVQAMAVGKCSRNVYWKLFTS